MTIIALALLFLASVTAIALFYFYFAGKYNSLITLRQHALQAWIDLTAADLRLARELRDHGFAAEAGLFEEAAHYAVAVFGQPSAPEHLSTARERALNRKPDHCDHLALIRVYEAKAKLYNATLHNPCCSLVAKCCGLHCLPS